MTLPRVLLQCLSVPFLSAIFPRLGLLILRSSQPILIEQAVRFVQGHTNGDSENAGYWLIVAAVVVYLGQTVSIT